MLPNRLAIIASVAILTVGFVIGGVLLTNKAQNEMSVVVPELSLEATAGKAAFETHCVECHGSNATGTDKGPPLVHSIYRPSLHADFAFVRAITIGVPQHHWLFGQMPPQPRLRRDEIDRITVYIRELQKANGIQ
jgi:mono/diheme cytochrome c family protein